MSSARLPPDFAEAARASAVEAVAPPSASRSSGRSCGARGKMQPVDAHIRGRTARAAPHVRRSRRAAWRASGCSRCRWRPCRDRPERGVIPMSGPLNTRRSRRRAEASTRLVEPPGDLVRSARQMLRCHCRDVIRQGARGGSTARRGCSGAAARGHGGSHRRSPRREASTSATVDSSRGAPGCAARVLAPGEGVADRGIFGAGDAARSCSSILTGRLLPRARPGMPQGRLRRMSPSASTASRSAEVSYDLSFIAGSSSASAPGRSPAHPPRQTGRRLDRHAAARRGRALLTAPGSLIGPGQGACSASWSGCSPSAA